MPWNAPVPAALVPTFVEPSDIVYVSYNCQPFVTTTPQVVLLTTVGDGSGVAVGVGVGLGLSVGSACGSSVPIDSASVTPGV